MHKLMGIWLLVGCVPVGAGPAEDPLAQLERETGAAWSVRRHPDGTVAWLEGRGPPSNGAPATAARGFVTRYGPLFGLGPDDGLSTRSVDTDELGMAHVRLDQTRNGIAVVGGELVAHFDRTGALVRVNGHGRQISSSGPSVPVYSADQTVAAAKLMAMALAPSADPELLVAETASSWVWPTEDGSGRLAWKVEVEVRALSTPRLLEVFVDAVDGTLLRHAEGLRRLQGRGLGFFGDERSLSVLEHDRHYWLEDEVRGGAKTSSASGKPWIPGIVVESKTSDAWDGGGAAPGAAVDVHAHLATLWDHFVAIHGRHGWKDDNHGVHATVHFGAGSHEAFFNGTILVFGDGDGFAWSPPGSAVDIVAHEWVHGLIGATAQLGPTGDAGAVAEAMADVLGVLASTPVGAAPEWSIGKAVYHPLGPHARRQPVRSLAWPHNTGQAAHRSELILDGGDGSDDTPVYYNAGMVAHAGYLMSEGADGAGLGPTTTEQIWFRALCRFLTSDASYADVVDATLAAARELGADDQPVRAAWIAVGLLDAE